MMCTVNTIRLPRALEEHESRDAVLRLLVDRSRPLYPGSEIQIPELVWTAAVERTVKGLLPAGRLCRGLDGAAGTLKAEQQGLVGLQKKTGTEQAARVSRLIIAANDGSLNFYKEIERLILRNFPRVLCCVFCVDSAVLGEALYGKGALAKCVMAVHKDAVIKILLSAAADNI